MVVKHYSREKSSKIIRPHFILISSILRLVNFQNKTIISPSYFTCTWRVLVSKIPLPVCSSFIITQFVPSVPPGSFLPPFLPLITEHLRVLPNAASDTALQEQTESRNHRYCASSGSMDPILWERSGSRICSRTCRRVRRTSRLLGASRRASFRSSRAASKCL